MTVCAPIAVAEHEAPAPGHDPLGVIAKLVPAVTSPSELLKASNASTV